MQQVDWPNSRLRDPIQVNYSLKNSHASSYIIAITVNTNTKLFKALLQGQVHGLKWSCHKKTTHVKYMHHSSFLKLRNGNYQCYCGKGFFFQQRSKTRQTFRYQQNDLATINTPIIYHDCTTGNSIHVHVVKMNNDLLENLGQKVTDKVRTSKFWFVLQLTDWKQ